MANTSVHEWDEERHLWHLYDTPTHRVEVVPILFNDLLVLTPHHCLHVYDYGWCYNKGGHAFKAAAAWDPATEPEPPGYKKRATHIIRELPEATT